MVIEFLYVCVVCGHALHEEHQVCSHACYSRLVRRWAEAMS